MSEIKSFKDLYFSEVVSNLERKFQYTNKHQIPKLVKIVINMGVGKAVSDSKIIKHAKSDLRLISGQEPIVITAKKSIATFKLREGVEIGCKVTLRKSKMFEFLERIVIMGFPRTKGFKGFSSKSFDGNGNFNFGIKEQTIFPEVDHDKTDSVRGMDVTIVTTAKSDNEGRELLSAFLPFYN